MRYTLSFFVILFLLFSGLATAHLRSRGMLWAGFDLSGKFSTDSKWHYDIINQGRFADNRSSLEQYFFRPSIYYQYNKKWSFWVGYDLIPTIPRNSLNSFLEQRIWSQTQYAVKFAKYFELSSRTRLEMRWRQNRQDTAYRLRQRLDLSFIDFNHLGINIDIFDELFLGLNNASWVTDRTLDQNRIFLGLIIPLRKNFALEVGYLNILRPRSPNNLMDNVFVAALAFNFSGGEFVPINFI